MKKLLAVLWVLSLTACASSSGFNRGYLRSSLGEQQKEITDSDIKKALEAKAQLPDPFKMAIYTHLDAWRVNCNEQDKSELDLLAGNLIAAGVVSDVIYINSSMFEGKGHAAIRLAAARAGADAVLMVHGAGTSDRYNNALGATYFLLVTPFFVPGTVSDGLFMLSASLWDVRNQYLYLSAEAEGTASRTGTAVHLKDHQVVSEAKTKAIKALRLEIESQLLSIQ
jgi:hypothetical protein